MPPPNEESTILVDFFLFSFSVGFISKKKGKKGKKLINSMNLT
jgi:hypothetical protein